MGYFSETSLGLHFGLEIQTLNLSFQLFVLQVSLKISVQTSKFAQNGFHDFNGLEVPSNPAFGISPPSRFGVGEERFRLSDSRR